MSQNRELLCPTCSSNGSYHKLVLRQINFTTAIYLCEQEDCSYPDGYDVIEVERNLDDIFSNNISQGKETVSLESDILTNGDDFDDWLNEVFNSHCGIDTEAEMDKTKDSRNNTDSYNIETHNIESVISKNSNKAIILENIVLNDTKVEENITFLNEEINKMPDAAVCSNATEINISLDKTASQKKKCKKRRKGQRFSKNKKHKTMYKPIIITSSQDSNEICDTILRTLGNTSRQQEKQLKSEKMPTCLYDVPSPFQDYNCESTIKNQKDTLKMTIEKPVTEDTPQIKYISPAQWFEKKRRDSISALKTLPMFKNSCHVIQKV